MQNVTLCGGCVCPSRNPLKTHRGWAAILAWNGQEHVLADAEYGTGVCRMELNAVVEGLSALKKPCNVRIKTGSQYVCDCATRMFAWRRNGWRNKNGKQIDNEDLIQELYNLCRTHKCTFVHVNNDPDVERCKQLATDKVNNMPYVQLPYEDWKLGELEEAVRKLVSRSA